MNLIYKFLTFILIFITELKLFNSYKNYDYDSRFKNWIEEHKIKIDNDYHLIEMYDNWLSNDIFINETNYKNLSYSLGHNMYSGMNQLEFKKYMGFSNNKSSWDTVFMLHQEKIKELNSLPLSIDWRTQNAVTNIKNQGQCGSCWSFSTTGALEGIYAIKYKKLIIFSEQQLVDCDNGINKNHACNGGLMNSAFNWISQNGGLCSEADYPYVSGTKQKSEKCQHNCKLVDNSKISNYILVTSNSDIAMMTALLQQPVSVAIEADERDFQLYKSGVFTSNNCGTNIDHGVLLVGYGTSNGLDYYILKNSWDNSWGMDGYILLGRGKNPNTGKPYNNGAGQCGVLSEGLYPLL